jgi:hypothetical protein
VNNGRFRHAAHLDEECALYTAAGKEKAPQTGEVVCGAEEANTGEELFADLFEGPFPEDYLETLTAWIALSWALASRASMGANITLPPRRRLTSIPAIAGRMLATPCAWGRISVTVDLAITGRTKQRACHPGDCRKINDLGASLWSVRRRM